MITEHFEELAHGAPETVELELIEGRLREKPPRDGDHGAILQWLLRRCREQRPALGLFLLPGLRVGTDPPSRLRPDGFLAPLGHFAGRREWHPADGGLMAVEVSSFRPGDPRDRRAKRRAYARAGVPVQVFVDRRGRRVVVHSDPASGDYRRRTSHAYGASLRLPDPVGVTLDTERLKNYAR